MKLHWYLVFLIMALLNACEWLNLKREKHTSEDVEGIALARAKDSYLYARDLEGVIPSGIGPQDSVALVKRHIDNWIKKQLLIAEARRNLDFDEVEIERKVLDYRYALMMHEFERIYVNNRIDTEVSEEEISAYYRDNIENFELDQNIARGLFVQIPKEAPKIARFRYLLRSGRPDDMEELKSYCYRFANKAHLEDSVWMYFSDIALTIPMDGVVDEQAFFRTNKYYETSDESYHYFMKISDYRLQGETSPLEFVADEIRKIIIHKRKVAIVKELEETIYDNAVRNKDFEILIP